MTPLPTVHRCTRCRTALSARMHQKIAAGRPGTGLCAPCWRAANRKPKPTCRDCGTVVSRMSRDKRCHRCAAIVREADMAFRARRTEAVRAAIRRPEVLAIKQRVARENGRKRLSWLPREFEAEYRRLRLSFRLPAAEARRRIEAKMLAKGRPIERRSALSFEDQLRAVAEGRATISANVTIRRPDPAITLGGVSGAML